MNVDEQTTRESLQTQLEALEGVRRAFVDGPPWKIVLICDHPSGNPAATEVDARALLAKSGLAADDAELQVSFLTPPARRQRVRFVHATVRTESATRAIATVALEWDGEVVEEVREGDASPVSVLRLCAAATIGALERLIGGVLEFQLIGIKIVRVFDGDLVVALLRTDQGPQRQFLGATLVADDAHRAAALAVLNATNRVLGNYLNIATD